MWKPPNKGKKPIAKSFPHLPIPEPVIGERNGVPGLASTNEAHL